MNNHAEMLRQMAAEWRANDELSQAMLDLALRVSAARRVQEDKK